MELVLQDLATLEEVLVGELNKRRVEPFNTSVKEDSMMRSRELSDEIQSLQLDMQNAGDLIESLKDEVSHEISKNKQLRAQLAEANRLRAVSQVSHSSSTELDTERRLRLRAEEELSAYRRQNKSSDSNVTTNAQRIAVTLARHCVELSHQLELHRSNKAQTDTHEAKELIAACIFPGGHQGKKTAENQTVPKPRHGWGLEDDDDLFASLTKLAI